MNSFHMTMVLKYGVEEMSLSQTNIQLEQINEPCSGQSVHSYTSPNYACLRCRRTSSPNYLLGLLIGLLYTNLRASTVLQRAGAVLLTAGAAGAVFSHTRIKHYNNCCLQTVCLPFHLYDQSFGNCYGGW